MQAHADVAEERDGVADGKAAQDAADDGATAAPEIGIGDGSIGDVAAGAAADENLRAEMACAVDEDDAAVRMKPPDEDRGREAGGAGSDDRDIERTRKLGGQK